ncbi:hypothetical protein [Niveispirillum sp.]|uniref:hypothetical protein n=1 Tax=Niveispirillum sp. TaxID=1917217 RepID=UPI001B726F6D|nr:hypothetical protein [Niveispirillum sp.]MBP7338317.1 hypothetical protein [Niveispirillum sp.]
MRTLIALAFVAALGVTAAHASDSAQVAAKEPAATVARTEPVSSAEARDIARTWMKTNNYRFGRVGDVRKKDDVFLVELKSADGIRFATLKIDVATGQIVS